jgi:hypothetical protein
VARVGSGRDDVIPVEPLAFLCDGRNGHLASESEADVSQFVGGASARLSSGSDGPAILSGIGVGVVQAATPLAFWWLGSAIVYALGLAAIAAIYVGFAVGDGRMRVIAVESCVAFAFVVVAAAAITATPWLLVVGFVGHGLKDLWQHRTHFVNNTRWWPPFCMAVDFVVAAVIAVEIAAGLHFR